MECIWEANSVRFPRASKMCSVLLVIIHKHAINFFPCIISATEYHLGLLKAKLAKYRAQLLEPSKSAGAKGEGFDVMKSGDARVALIGFPSVGKVSPLNRVGDKHWFPCHSGQHTPHTSASQLFLVYT